VPLPATVLVAWCGRPPPSRVCAGRCQLTTTVKIQAVTPGARGLPLMVPVVLLTSQPRPRSPCAFRQRIRGVAGGVHRHDLPVINRARRGPFTSRICRDSLLRRTQVGAWCSFPRSSSRAGRTKRRELCVEEASSPTTSRFARSASGCGPGAGHPAGMRDSACTTAVRDRRGGQPARFESDTHLLVSPRHRRPAGPSSNPTYGRYNTWGKLEIYRLRRERTSTSGGPDFTLQPFHQAPARHRLLPAVGLIGTAVDRGLNRYKTTNPRAESWFILHGAVRPFPYDTPSALTSRLRRALSTRPRTFSIAPAPLIHFHRQR